MRWRHVLRDNLHGAMSVGGQILGVTRDGQYVLTMETAA